MAFNAENKYREKRQVLEGLDKMGTLPNKVIICVTGSFNEGQKQRILKKSHIRRDKCNAAMDWLVENNIHYRQKYSKGYNLDDLNDPVLIDFSSSSNNQNNSNNIEKSEEICVVFPDNSLNEITAGQNSYDDLKKFVSSLQNQESVNAQVNIPDTEFVRDFDRNNFSMSFIRQYPYGYGGLEEERILKKWNYRKDSKR